MNGQTLLPEKTSNPRQNPHNTVTFAFAFHGMVKRGYLALIKVTMSMPPLLSDIAPNEVPIFIPRLFSERPKQAAMVAETITTWSYAEHSLGKIVAGMSRSKGTSTLEMRNYANNWQFSKRKVIITKLVKANLAEPYLTTFLKTLDVVAGLSKRRNAFAHGIWTAVEALPDRLLLVDPKHIFMHWGAAHDWLAAFAGGLGPLRQLEHLDNKHIEVWSSSDLAEEVGHVKKAYELASGLEALASEDLFDAKNPKRDHVLRLLQKDPLIGP